MTAPYSSGSSTPPAAEITQRGYFTDSAASLIAPDDQPVIILVSHINRATFQAVRYAKALSAEVLGLHIATLPESGAPLHDRWEHSAPEIPLIILPTMGRSLINSIAGYIDAVLEKHSTVTVIIVETIHPGWARRVRQLRTTSLIRLALRARKNIVVTTVQSK